MIEKIKQININIYFYFAITLFNNFWFITSNWVNYWLKYMSTKDIGIIDAIAFGVGLLVEIPSGFLADRLGRKTSLILANFFQFLGSFIITISVNKFEIAGGFIIFQIGVALFSGTIEAFGYEESLKNNLDYEKTLIRAGIISNIGYLISMVVGGYFYLINKNIPNFLWSINYLISLLISILIVVNSKQTSLFEDLPILENKFNLKDFIHNFNFKTTYLLIVISSMIFAFDYGFLKLFILDSFSSLNDNYIYLFIITSICLIINSYVTKKTTNYDFVVKIVYIFLTLNLILSFFIPNYEIVLFLVLSFLTIFIYQISLKFINERVGDRVRASFISFYNFAFKIPYVILALVLGFGLESYGIKHIFLYLSIFLIIMGLFSKLIPKMVYNNKV